jgi:hypothetical protein
VNGGSHNTLIVATNDGLIAVEAPGDDGQSKIVMGLAEQNYRKRGKSRGGMIIRFTGGHESDSLRACRRPAILTACRTPS